MHGQEGNAPSASRFPLRLDPELNLPCAEAAGTYTGSHYSNCATSISVRRRSESIARPALCGA